MHVVVCCECREHTHWDRRACTRTLALVWCDVTSMIRNYRNGGCVRPQHGISDLSLIHMQPDDRWICEGARPAKEIFAVHVSD